MSAALLERRRGVAAGAGWNPSQLPGVLAYWNADDVAGAAGASVSSWTDRKAAISVAQATGSQQPTIVTNSGGTGHKALRFTAASLQILSGAIGSLPAQGPVWVWWVAKPISPGTQAAVVEAALSGNTTKGWVVDLASNKIDVTAWGVANDTTTLQQPTGSTSWIAASFDPVTNHQVAVYRNAQAPVFTAAAAANANAGATSFSIGGSLAHPTSAFYLDAELQIVLVGSGAAPSTANLYKMATWLWQNYGLYCGTPYQSASSVAVAGKDHLGAATTDAIELGVIYNPAGVFGHKYWTAFAPYVAGTPDENPNLNFSDDGNTWSAGTISNPLVAYPGGGASGNNADPSIFDNSTRDGLLYILRTLESATPNSTDGIYIGSYNGTSYTEIGQIVSGISSSECPVMAYDTASSSYWLYTMLLGSPTTTSRQTAASPTGPFSAATACTISGLPSGVSPWHISAPIKIASKWVIVFSDNGAGSTRHLWIASSTDGLAWKVGNTGPLVVPSLTNWDQPSIYRGAIQDAGDGTNLLLWYVAGTGASGGGTLFGQKVTIPQTVIP